MSKNETKLTFAERYPNHHRETRHERITHMSPASGWWKIETHQCWYPEDEEKIEFYHEIYAVAFFAQVEYEERSVWDGGQSQWGKEVITIAHTAGNDDWDMQVMEVASQSNLHSQLFYDPDYRRDDELPSSMQRWLKSNIEYRTNWEKDRVRREKEKVA